MFGLKIEAMIVVFAAGMPGIACHFGIDTVLPVFLTLHAALIVGGLFFFSFVLCICTVYL